MAVKCCKYVQLGGCASKILQIAFKCEVWGREGRHTIGGCGGLWGSWDLTHIYVYIYIYIHITYHTYTLLYNAEEWIEIWIRFNYTIYDIYHLSIYTSRLHYKSLDEMRLDG